jgi:hypothetical protein
LTLIVLVGVLQGSSRFGTRFKRYWDESCASFSGDEAVREARKLSDSLQDELSADVPPVRLRACCMSLQATSFSTSRQHTGRHSTACHRGEFCRSQGSDWRDLSTSETCAQGEPTAGVLYITWRVITLCVHRVNAPEKCLLPQLQRAGGTGASALRRRIATPPQRRRTRVWRGTTQTGTSYAPTGMM